LRLFFTFMALAAALSGHNGFKRLHGFAGITAAAFDTDPQPAVPNWIGNGRRLPKAKRRPPKGPPLAC
jgi:hypothetical protein